MRISPIDIQQKQFRSRPFGYEKVAVDQFLELLAEELERLLRVNQDLQEELDRTRATLAEMREREGTLKETLVATQKITEEMKTTARREVDVMMAEAQIKSERLLRNAEERRLQLIEEIQEIKRQKVDFEVSLRGLLEKHIRMLELNVVAIDRQDADAKLIEEPLPFTRRDEREPSAENQDVAAAEEEGVEDAEFAEPEQSGQAADPLAGQSRPGGRPIPDLTFDFDNDELDEEDLFR